MRKPYATNYADAGRIDQLHFMVKNNSEKG